MVLQQAFPLDVAIGEGGGGARGGCNSLSVGIVAIRVKLFKTREKVSLSCDKSMDDRLGVFIGIFVRDSAVVTKSQDKCIPIYQNHDWSLLFPSGKDDKVKIVQIRGVYYLWIAS